MRTTININESTIDELLLYYNAKTKTEAVNKALEEWARYLKKQKLITLRGKVDIDDFTKEMNTKEIEELKRYE